MKKIISIGTGLLLLSTAVFADNHTAAALEHANAAVVNGADGQTPLLLEQTKAALSVPKTHFDAAAKELKEANELGNLGHIGSATTHAEAAVKHIETGNRYIGYINNSQKH
jgi:Small metal-binding protein